MRPIIFASAIAVFSSLSASPSLSVEYAGLTDSLENATVSVLSKLGYDCTTETIGIICKKCKVENNKQKCEAFICDAVSKKCRKKSAEIPQIPGL